MGRRRAISHRSLAICLRERTAETKSKQRCGPRRFSGRARLSRVATNRCDRLEIRRFQRGAIGAVGKIWREQHFRDEDAQSQRVGGRSSEENGRYCPLTRKESEMRLARPILFG